MILVNDNDVVTRPTCVIMDGVIMNVICVVVLWWGVSTSTTVWAQEYFMILGHHQVATDMKLPDGREWKLLLLNCLCRLIGDSVTHESMAATAGNWWGSIYGLGLERSFVIALLLLLLIGVFFFVVVFLPSRFLPLDMTSPQKETVPALFCFLFFLFFLLFFFWLYIINSSSPKFHKLKSKARALLHWPWQPELTSVQSLTECSHVDFIIFTQSGVEAPNVFTLNHKLPSSGTCVHNQSHRPSQLHHEPQKVSRVPRVPLQHK